MSEAPTVTVYWYSQTGQLREAAGAFVAPLEKAGWRVDWVEVTPREDYPFPWPVRKFFGVFPGSVDNGGAIELDPLPAPPPARPGDLVLFAFQVWYLAPSPPMRAVINRYPQVLDGRDVLGLVACRNMWFSAAAEVQAGIAAAGGRYAGTVAATDTSPTITTIVTTLRWLLTGRREAFWKVFPRAGVGEDELARLAGLGEALAKAGPPDGSDMGAWVGGALWGTEPAVVPSSIAFGDIVAGRAFRVWGRAIRWADRGGPLAQGALLIGFVASLGASIAVGLPLTVLLRIVARRRIDNAISRRLAPALVRTEAATLARERASL